MCQNFYEMIYFCSYAKFHKKCKRFSNKAAKAFPPIFSTPTSSYYPIELSLASQKESPHFDSIRCVPKKSHVAIESSIVWPEDQQSSWQVFFSHLKISMIINIVKRLIQLKVRGGGRLCFLRIQLFFLWTCEQICQLGICKRLPGWFVHFLAHFGNDKKQMTNI